MGLACPQSIYKWINGEALPTVDHLFELAKLFNISVDDFLIGTTQEDSIEEKVLNQKHIYEFGQYSFMLSNYL